MITRFRFGLRTLLGAVALLATVTAGAAALWRSKPEPREWSDFHCFHCRTTRSAGREYLSDSETDFTRWYLARRPGHEHQWIHIGECSGMPDGWIAPWHVGGSLLSTNPMLGASPEAQRAYLESVDPAGWDRFEQLLRDGRQAEAVNQVLAAESPPRVLCARYLDAFPGGCEGIVRIADAVRSETHGAAEIRYMCRACAPRNAQHAAPTTPGARERVAPPVRDADASYRLHFRYVENNYWDGGTEVSSAIGEELLTLVAGATRWYPEAERQYAAAWGTHAHAPGLVAAFRVRTRDGGELRYSFCHGRQLVKRDGEYLVVPAENRQRVVELLHSRIPEGRTKP